MTVVYGYWNNGSPGDICSSSFNDFNVVDVDNVDTVDPVVVVDVMDALVDVEDIGELGEDFGLTTGYWWTFHFNSFLGDYIWVRIHFEYNIYTLNI